MKCQGCHVSVIERNKPSVDGGNESLLHSNGRLVIIVAFDVEAVTAALVFVRNARTKLLT